MTQGPLALYVPWLTVGGVQRVTTTIANGLASRGHEVDLVLSFREGDLLDQVSDDVRIVDLGTRRVPGIGIGASIPALARYLSRREPSMVFSQMTYANVVCLLARRVSGVDTEVYATEHNTFGMKDDRKEQLTNRAAGRLYPRADRVLAVSEGVADSVAAGTPLDRSAIRVMHNPVDVAEIRERARQPVDHRWVDSDDHEVVLSVGRLAGAKDLETWLRAFARVADRRPEVRGVVAGRGPERDSLRSLASRLGVGDRVSFPGYVDNPYGFMARASTFLLSSRHEGLPTTLIEALACGCPVVSTDCPSGPREILDGGTYGRLVDVGDERGLAGAVEETLQSPPDRDALRRRADDFATETVIDEYERFIRERADLDVDRRVAAD